jgi:glutamyl-tRNA synthetase
MNKEYIKRLSKERLEKEIKEKLDKKYSYTPELLNKILPTITDRISTFGELEKYVTEGEFDYFFIAPTPIKEMLIWKKDTDFSIPKNNLQKLSEIIKTIPETDFVEEKLKEIIMPKAEELGRGSALWPLRVALSGKDKSPDPFTLLSTLGKEESLERIGTALNIL